jgi:glutamate--cysteine ligase
MEKPTLALRRRGIGYVELRSLDVNVFHPLGVAEEQLHFMETFMLFCLLADSPRINSGERRAIDENLVLAAHRGRDPGLELNRQGRGIALRQWALGLLDAMVPAAELMDGGSGGPCADSLHLQRDKVRNTEQTPSARMLSEMRANNETFFEYARRVSEQHRDHFLGLDLSDERQAFFDRLARESRDRQRELEETDDISFDAFLERYFAKLE